MICPCSSVLPSATAWCCLCVWRILPVYQRPCCRCRAATARSELRCIGRHHFATMVRFGAVVLQGQASMYPQPQQHAGSRWMPAGGEGQGQGASSAASIPKIIHQNFLGGKSRLEREAVRPKSNFRRDWWRSCVVSVASSAPTFHIRLPTHVWGVRGHCAYSDMGHVHHMLKNGSGMQHRKLSQQLSSIRQLDCPACSPSCKP